LQFEKSGLGSFEDLQPEAVIQFHPSGVENRVDGSGSMALPANDFSEIARGNPHFGSFECAHINDPM